MGAFVDIRRFLHAVRRQLGLASALEGSAFLASSLLALAATVVLATWLFESMKIDIFRWIGVAGLSLIVLGVLIRWGLLPWRRLRRLRSIARHVERVEPQLRGGVLSCVELEQGLADIKANNRFSISLIEAHAAQTAAALTRRRPGDFVSWRRSRRFGQLLLVLGVVVGGMLLLFPEPFSEGAQALLAGSRPEARTPESPRTVEREVVVGDISYGFVYPAYTRLPGRLVKNSAGDLSALVGTQIRLETRALVPTESARLIFEGPEEVPIPLTVGAGGRIRGEWTVKESARFRFEVVRPDGVTVVERMRRDLEALPDKVPIIKLMRPLADLEVQTDDPVKLFFSASDDFGLKTIEVVTDRLGNDDPPLRRRVALLASDRTYAGEDTVDLKRLGLEPGETVECWLEAYDNNTVAKKPQRARSRKIKIKLHSAEEHHKELLDEERKLLERMLDLLADRLESPIPAQKLSRYDTLVDTQGGIARTAGGLIATFRTLLKALQSDPLASHTVRDDLREMITRHGSALTDELHHIKAALGETRMSDRSQHLAVLYRANEAAIAELERDILHFEHLIDQQHQKQLLDRARELAQAQKELMRLLEELKKTDDPALRMQIQQRIAQLMRRVSKLMADMRRGHKPMPYENMNMDALEPGERMQDLRTMKSALQKMQDAVKEGRLDDAMKLVEQLGRDVQTLQTTLESDLQELASGDSRKDAIAMKKIMGGLDKVVRRQGAIHRDTKAVGDAGRKKLSDLVRKEMAPRIAKELERIQELTKRLQKVAGDELHASDKKSLGEIRDAVKDLKETLSQEDLSQALKMAQKIHKELRALSEDVGKGADRMKKRDGDNYLVRKRERNAKRLAKAVPKAREIARELKRMMPSVDDLLDRGQQRKLKRLSERQKRAQERLGRVQGKLAGLKQRMPGLGARLEAALEGAQKAMGEAKARMDEKLPGKAESKAKAALDKLSEARKAIQQAGQKPGQGKGRDGAGVGGAPDRVEVPDADRYTVPKEFRDQLLKAIKERAPQRYQPLIDRYYETLIR